MSEVYKVAVDLALGEEDEAKLPVSVAKGRVVSPLSISSIPVESVELPPIQGRVEGAWTLTRGSTPAQSFLLPDGETIKIPDGSAISIYSSSGEWVDYQLPLGGRLVGPLCYAPTEPADPIELVRKHTWSERFHRVERRWLAYSAVGTVGSLLVGIAGALSLPEDLPFVDLIGTAFVALPIIGIVFGASKGLNLALARAEKRETRRPRDIPNPPRHDHDVALPDRLRSLAGYDPALIEAKLAHYKADDLDRQIEAAASAYKAKRRELQRMAGPEVATIEHSASMLHEIAQKIAGSPRMLCDRATKEALLALIGRAQEQVEMKLSKREAAITADVMADIAALSKQIDREIGSDKSTQS